VCPDADDDADHDGTYRCTAMDRKVRPPQRPEGIPELESEANDKQGEADGGIGTLSGKADG
jgi:hypothetical protein